MSIALRNRSDMRAINALALMYFALEQLDAAMGRRGVSRSRGYSTERTARLGPHR